MKEKTPENDAYVYSEDNEILFDVEDADAEFVEPVASYEAAEEIEQIGKDIVVGTKEVSYEDDRNVISIIITAISLRVNMPRGTVKALMWCFAAVVLVIVLQISGLWHSWTHSYYDTAEYQKSLMNISRIIHTGAEKIGNQGMVGTTLGGMLVPEREVPLSEHYSYVVPAGSWEEPSVFDGYLIANDRAYSFYDGEGDWYLVVSYITKMQESVAETGEDAEAGGTGSETRDVDAKESSAVLDARLEQTTLAKLKEFEGFARDSLEYHYEESGGIRFLVCTYKILDEYNLPVNVIEYSWLDGEDTICVLEVSNPDKDPTPTAQVVRNTIHEADNPWARIDSLMDGYPDGYDPDDPVGMGIVDPDEAMEPNTDGILMERADEAWREYNQPDRDFTDRVLKP